MYDFVLAKKEYREFCAVRDDIPVFMQDWYMDAACEHDDDWRVILVKENDKIVAVFPFQYIKKKRYWYIENPFQAARAGIWVDYGNRVGNSKRESFLYNIVKRIIDCLPFYDVFNIDFYYDFKNWQCFYEHGFRQTTRYSYCIDMGEMDVNELLKSFQQGRKGDIKRAQSRCDVNTILTPSEYYEIFCVFCEKRKIKPSYEKKQFCKLMNYCISRNSGKFYQAKNKEGKTVAAVGVIWDRTRMYNMFMTMDVENQDRGLALLLFTAMQDAAKEGLLFDFEGSMIPGVADYYKQFNGDKEEYYSICGYSDRYKLRIAFHDCLYGVLKRLKLYGILRGLKRKVLLVKGI